ncbi:MAG: hypothetical protein H6718_24085 [Polyangiaceae bacterium]|nr:hypothetical protein [Myxococcales bacterium]MCB9588510.1 hypothetical protein [Polyangiaceae bacterium]
MSILLIAAMTQPALAQGAEECDLTPRECGRRAFDAGVEAFKKEDYPAALAQFRQAYEVQQHPIVVFNLALAEAKLNLPLEAMEHFEQLLADPAAEAELKSRAKTELELAQGLVASVSVEFLGSDKGSRSIELQVGDQSSKGDAPTIRVNPGKYHVSVTVDGKEVVSRDLELAPSERFRLAVDQSGAVTAPQDSAPKDVQPEQHGLSPVWAYVGVGLTAVLGGLTLWSGLDTQAAVQDFDEREATLPEAEAQALLDDGHAKETRTNILIGATGVVGVTTLVLAAFFVDWGGRKHPEQAFVTGPVVGPALDGSGLSLGYRGRF